MAEEFHYTYTIYSTQYRPGGCGVHGWGSRMYVQFQQDCTYCLRQRTCMSLNSPVVNIPTTTLFVIKNAELVQQYTIEYTSFKIQSGNFKCDLPIVLKCLIQQCKVYKCEGQSIQTTSLL